MSKQLFTILLILLGYASLPAQNIISADALDKKAQKQYNSAMDCFKKKDYACCSNKMVALVTKYPTFFEGYKLLSQSSLKQGDLNQALDYLLEMDRLSENVIPPVKLEIANIAEQLGDYETAIKHIAILLESGVLKAKVKSRITRRYDELRFRQSAYQNPVAYHPQPLGKEINTKDHEYLPAFNADASQLIYSKLYIVNGVQQSEDLYISIPDSLNNFGEGKPLEDLNTSMNEGAHSLSQDGNIILFTACHRADSFGGCDLYISIKKNGAWSTAKNMGSGINSRSWDAQPCIANNNKTIIFSSNRPGGYGGSDLWRIDLLDDKIWSEPVNLGPVINTSGNEESPFLHPDNYSLYFRSDGHIGMGDFDLFVARQIDFNQFSPVQNLGYPINTTANDGAMFVALNGNVAYYSTDAFTQGDNLDIVSFNLPEWSKPLAVSYLKINVKDALSKTPIEAEVQLSRIGPTMEKLISRTDLNGALLMPVGIGEYALSIQKSTYLFHSEHIKVDSTRDANSPYIYNVYLQKIPDDKSPEVSEVKAVVLNNIFFNSGSADMLESSYIEIDNLYGLLIRQPQLKIKIIGHTDNVGDKSDNIVLSEQRARSVYDALIIKGIDAARLAYEGRGESDPIATNDTASGKKANRRTEFIIIE